MNNYEHDESLMFFIPKSRGCGRCPRHPPGDAARPRRVEEERVWESGEHGLCGMRLYMAILYDLYAIPAIPLLLRNVMINHGF